MPETIIRRIIRLFPGKAHVAFPIFPVEKSSDHRFQNIRRLRIPDDRLQTVDDRNPQCRQTVCRGIFFHRAFAIRQTLFTADIKYFLTSRECLFSDITVRLWQIDRPQRFVVRKCSFPDRRILPAVKSHPGNPAICERLLADLFHFP